MYKIGKHQAFAGPGIGKRVQNPLLVELIVKLAATPVILLGLYFALRVSNLTGLAATVSIVLITVSMAVVALQRWAVRRRHIAGALVRRPERQRLSELMPLDDAPTLEIDRPYRTVAASE